MNCANKFCSNTIKDPKGLYCNSCKETIPAAYAKYGEITINDVPIVDVKNEYLTLVEAMDIARTKFIEQAIIVLRKQSSNNDKGVNKALKMYKQYNHTKTKVKNNAII